MSVHLMKPSKSPFIMPRLPIKGRMKGLRPFINYSSPSPLKERGIKGVRLA